VYPSAVIAGKYRLESKIGEGGMGSVWRATHLRLDKPVAVKIVSPSHAASFDARWRFQSEARAAAKLQSKNVVHIEDIGELEDGTPFLVMELLTGLSLEQRIARDGPLQLPEAQRIIGQVCRVLSRAHAEGIIHRDIKPENLFLAYLKDEDNPVVKVLDFGVAKSASAASTSTTQSGALIGTPMYASPEQARARKDIDGRSDLYSLGLVTYVMLTGRDPFDAESLADLIIQICTGPLPRLREAAPHPMPPAMEEWFARACAREPTHRFPNAEAFSEAFAHAAGLPQPSRPGPASDGQLMVPSEITGPVPLAPRSTRTLAHAQTLEAHVRAPTSRPSHVPALLLAVVALVGAAGVGAIVLRPGPAPRAPASPVTSVPLVASSAPAPVAVSVTLASASAAPVLSAPSVSASTTAVASRPVRTSTAALPPTPAPRPAVPKKPDLGY
jgi:eukaryotic-like serine/threonine-protein kinase